MELESEKIRLLRLSKGWKLKQFAEKTGISAASLSEIERGGGARPQNLKKIAEALGVEIDTLIKDGAQETKKYADRAEVAEKREQYNKGWEEGGEGGKISELLTRAAEVLESPSIYRQALSANINAFHMAIRTEEKNLNLQAQIDHLKSRLTTLEEKINK